MDREGEGLERGGQAEDLLAAPGARLLGFVAVVAAASCPASRERCEEADEQKEAGAELRRGGEGAGAG